MASDGENRLALLYEELLKELEDEIGVTITNIELVNRGEGVRAKIDGEKTYLGISDELREDFLDAGDDTDEPAAAIKEALSKAIEKIVNPQ